MTPQLVEGGNIPLYLWTTITLFVFSIGYLSKHR
jgi:hypothetical protein